jgi:hypothetical protein
LADRNHAAALRLLLGGVRDDDSRFGRFLALSRLHDDTIA